MTFSVAAVQTVTLQCTEVLSTWTHNVLSPLAPGPFSCVNTSVHSILSELTSHHSEIKLEFGLKPLKQQSATLRCLARHFKSLADEPIIAFSDVLDIKLHRF